MHRGVFGLVIIPCHVPREALASAWLLISDPMAVPDHSWKPTAEVLTRSHSRQGPAYFEILIDLFAKEQYGRI